MKIANQTTMLALALTLTAGLASAQGPGERQRRAPSFDKIQETLGLSDAQLESLRENNQAMREAMRTAMEGTRETRQALRSEMQQENPNETVIAQHLAAMSEARQEAQAIRAQYRESALAVLDETQKAKVADIEAAVELARQAPGAAALNLIEGPGKGRPGFGDHGFGPRGPRGHRGGPRPGPAPDVE